MRAAQALQGHRPQLWPRLPPHPGDAGRECGDVVLGTPHEPGDVVVELGPQGVHPGSDASDTCQGPLESSTGLCGQTPASKAERGS